MNTLHAGDAQVWRQTVHGDAGRWLEPLGHQHADALARQYRDPQTAQLTGMAALKFAHQATAWIDHRLRQSPATYALMHREHGFIGYGDLYVGQLDAYLCLWIGVDHRGQGHGRALVDLLLSLAWRQGVPAVLTSALAHNVRSLRCLRSAGFWSIPAQAEPPNDARRFLICSPQPFSAQQTRDRLLDFYRGIESSMRFEP